MAFDIELFMESLNEGKDAAIDYLKNNEPREGFISFYDVCEQLENENLTMLFEVLNDQNSKIRTIDFDRCNLGDEKAKIIINALRKNKTITTLILNGNNLTDAVGRQIGQMLIRNDTLKGLYLGENNIGDKGAVNIAKGLQYNKTVKIFHAYSNEIKKAAIPIAENSNVREINLDGNLLGDEEVVRIAKTINEKKNQPKTIIVINNPDINYQGTKVLFAEKYKSKTPKIEFSNNNLINEPFVESLQKDLKAYLANKKKASKEGGRN